MQSTSNSLLPDGFPVECKSFSLEIQIGAVGTILYARKEQSVSADPTFNVSILFGKRDEVIEPLIQYCVVMPLLVACTRQLIEHISNSRYSRPLVVSLGLKDHSRATLRDICSAVIEHRLW